jgi:STE24 endopeptidase
MRNPAAVPVSLLVLVVLQLVSLPLQNSISRHQEEEADWVALETTRDPDGARGLFRKFTTLALSDPDPPAWFELLLGSHPSGLQRIELAEAWRARPR